MLYQGATQYQELRVTMEDYVAGSKIFDDSCENEVNFTSSNV